MTDDPSVVINRFFVGDFGAERLPDGTRTFTYTPPEDVLDGLYAVRLRGTPWILPHGRVN